MGKGKGVMKKRATLNRQTRNRVTTKKVNEALYQILRLQAHRMRLLSR